MPEIFRAQLGSRELSRACLLKQKGEGVLGTPTRVFFVAIGVVSVIVSFIALMRPMFTLEIVFLLMNGISRIIRGRQVDPPNLLSHSNAREMRNQKLAAPLHYLSARPDRRGDR